VGISISAKPAHIATNITVNTQQTTDTPGFDYIFANYFFLFLLTGEICIFIHITFVFIVCSDYCVYQQREARLMGEFANPQLLAEFRVEVIRAQIDLVNKESAVLSAVLGSDST